MTKMKKGIITYFGVGLLIVLIIILVYIFLKSQGILP